MQLSSRNKIITLWVWVLWFWALKAQGELLKVDTTRAINAGDSVIWKVMLHSPMTARPFEKWDFSAWEKWIAPIEEKIWALQGENGKTVEYPDVDIQISKRVQLHQIWPETYQIRTYEVSWTAWKAWIVKILAPDGTPIAYIGSNDGALRTFSNANKAIDWISWKVIIKDSVQVQDSLYTPTSAELSWKLWLESYVKIPKNFSRKKLEELKELKKSNPYEIFVYFWLKKSPDRWELCRSLAANSNDILQWQKFTPKTKPRQNGKIIDRIFESSEAYLGEETTWVNQKPSVDISWGPDTPEQYASLLTGLEKHTAINGPMSIFKDNWVQSFGKRKAFLASLQSKWIDFLSTYDSRRDIDNQKLALFILLGNKAGIFVNWWRLRKGTELSTLQEMATHLENNFWSKPYLPGPWDYERYDDVDSGVEAKKSNSEQLLPVKTDSVKIKPHLKQPLPAKVDSTKIQFDLDGTQIERDTKWPAIDTSSSLQKAQKHAKDLLGSLLSRFSWPKKDTISQEFQNNKINEEEGDIDYHIDTQTPLEKINSWNNILGQFNSFGQAEFIKKYMILRKTKWKYAIPDWKWTKTLQLDQNTMDAIINIGIEKGFLAQKVVIKKAEKEE